MAFRDPDSRWKEETLVGDGGQAKKMTPKMHLVAGMHYLCAIDCIYFLCFDAPRLDRTYASPGSAAGSEISSLVLPSSATRLTANNGRRRRRATTCRVLSSRHRCLFASVDSHQWIDQSDLAPSDSLDLDLKRGRISIHRSTSTVLLKPHNHRSNTTHTIFAEKAWRAHAWTQRSQGTQTKGGAGRSTCCARTSSPAPAESWYVMIGRACVCVCV